MKNRIKRIACKYGAVVSALALVLATVTANSTCYYFSHQPDEPEGLMKLKK